MLYCISFVHIFLHACKSLGGECATGENLLWFAPDEAKAAQALLAKAARGPGPSRQRAPGVPGGTEPKLAGKGLGHIWSLPWPLGLGRETALRDLGELTQTSPRPPSELPPPGQAHCG